MTVLSLTVIESVGTQLSLAKTTAHELPSMNHLDRWVTYCLPTVLQNPVGELLFPWRR